MVDEPYIRLSKIVKIFPGTVALDEVGLDIKKGEIHAIVGENGAGKSTFMKILSGVYKKTSGIIYVNGEEARINSVQDALELGITMIHQELANMPKLSVAENIFIGNLPRSRIFKIVNFKKLFINTQDIFNSYGININVKALLGSLTIAEKQFVEIIKAIILNNTKIVIMDEPTSSLTKSETEKLFLIIEKLKKENLGIIYISHRIDEVMEIADRTTVFRDGRKIGTLLSSEYSEDKIVSMMIGHSIKKTYKKKLERKEVVFEIKNLSIENRVYNFNAKLHKGEILGIGGLMGSGKDLLIKSLFGLWPTKTKATYFFGKEIFIKNPLEALKYDIVYLPEERKTQALFLDLSVKMNISATWLYKKYRRFFIKNILESNLAKDYIQQLSIKTPSQVERIINLSGGNQQKVIFARLLSLKPKIMVLNDPTRGIDVGSKDEIYNIIRNLVEQGTSIIIISSELDEICNLANRVIIISKGETIGDFLDDDVTLENILPCVLRVKSNA